MKNEQLKQALEQAIVDSNEVKIKEDREIYRAGTESENCQPSRVRRADLLRI